MNNRGFTIIELVLVIIVAAIIAAVAVPKFAQYWAGIKAGSAAMKIASDIRYAQNRATTTQQRSQVSFAAATSYTINYCTSANYNGSTCTCASWTQDKIIDWATPTSEFFGVTLSSSQNPLEFDSLGRPYNTGCTPLAVTTIITASYSGSPKNITVTTQTGMVSVN